MKAAPGDLPHDDKWAYEVKWDGMRILAHTDGTDVVLRSSNGIDATARFPELASLNEAVGNRSAVLDGEVVAFDENGLPSFGLLQQRMHVANAAEVARRVASVPVTFVVFDLLYFDGTDAMKVPFANRRELLTQLVDSGPTWRVTDIHDDGAALLEAVVERELEGVVAKRLDSHYQPGKRSSLWRKIKMRKHQELVVGGWGPGKGNRSGRIGGLLVGYYEGDVFRYAGRVGSGLNEVEIKRLIKLFAPLVANGSPFDEPVPAADAKGATWLRPEVVVEVAIAEWSGVGRMRHPSYLGQRIDTDPRSVVRE